MQFRWTWDKISNWMINKDSCRNTIFHISNGSEILLMSILKLSVDGFIFSEKKGNYYLPLNKEYSGFLIYKLWFKKVKK